MNQCVALGGLHTNNRLKMTKVDHPDSREPVSICHLAGRRERSKVPYIVRQCIEEVEKRGIDEVGIYRISGVATDIQALKTAFDTSKALSSYAPTARKTTLFILKRLRP